MFNLFFTSLFLISFANAGPGGFSLGDALSSRKKTFMQKMPKEVVELHERNIKEMKAAGIEKKTLKTGDKVPDVKVTIGGKEYPISRIYGTKPLVLKFYRGGWCGYCVTELKHYETLNKDFKEAGSQIVAISPDTEKMNQKTRSTNNLSFDIVSDKGHEIAKKFGLVYTLDSTVVKSLKEGGIDIAAYQNSDKGDLSIPATYVINKQGRIVFAYVDADYRQRAEPATVLKAVKEVKNNY